MTYLSMKVIDILLILRLYSLFRMTYLSMEVSDILLVLKLVLTFFFFKHLRVNSVWFQASFKRCLSDVDCMVVSSAEFTYWLKPRVSTFRFIIFSTVIGLSHLCCHNVLYFLNNPLVIFLTQLHSISDYCRILSTPHHLCLYWNWLNQLPSSSSREGGELGGTSQVE
jgi:hypothetical protein